MSHQTEFLSEHTFFFVCLFYFCDRLFVSLWRVWNTVTLPLSPHLSICLYLYQYCCVAKNQAAFQKNTSPKFIISSAISKKSNQYHKWDAYKSNLLVMEQIPWSNFSCFWEACISATKAVNPIKTHYTAWNVGFSLKPRMQFLHSAYSDISI